MTNHEPRHQTAGTSAWPILRREVQRISGVLFHTFAIRKFEAASGRVNDLEGAVDLAFSFRHLGIFIRPYQDQQELLEFARMANALQPKVVLEIGPGFGGSLFVLTRASSSDATLISMDLPARAFGMGHPRWMDRMFQTFPVGEQKIHVVRGDSHDPGTVGIVERLLNGRSVDLLFIDGDHTYEGVKKDFEMYSRLVRKGGLVAFHDILPNPGDPDFGVSNLWNEVKGRFPSQEIVNPEGPGIILGGFGILHM